MRNRHTYNAASFKVSKELMKVIMKIFIEELEPIRDKKGITCSLPLMLITKEEISHMSKNGGNPLGIKEEDGPLLCELLPNR
jgi:hypothetical protein